MISVFNYVVDMKFPGKIISDVNTNIYITVHTKEDIIINGVGRASVILTKNFGGFVFRCAKFHTAVVAL